MEPHSLGYEFAQEDEARSAADLVESVFSEDTAASRLQDARALLGELGAPVHPDDLKDYKRATEEGGAGLPDWIRHFFGGRY